MFAWLLFQQNLAMGGGSATLPPDVFNESYTVDIAIQIDDVFDVPGPP